MSSDGMPMFGATGLGLVVGWNVVGGPQPGRPIWRFFQHTAKLALLGASVAAAWVYEGATGFGVACGGALLGALLRLIWTAELRRRSAARGLKGE